MDATSSEGDSSEGGIDPHPHTELQIAKKLNPSLQVWLWISNRASNINPPQWLPVENPIWMPAATYTVTPSRRVNPNWSPLVQRQPTSDSHHDTS